MGLWVSSSVGPFAGSVSAMVGLSPPSPHLDSSYANQETTSKETQKEILQLESFACKGISIPPVWW